MTMNQNEIEKFFSDNPMPAAWFVAAKQGYIDVIHHISNNSMVEDVDMPCHLPSFDSYDHGSTALHLAIRAGHSDVVALLCKLGADPARTSNYSNHELNGLFQAIYRGHDTIVAQLLTQFADLKNTRGFYDYTPLHAAVIVVDYADSTRVVSTLLNHGCSINEGLADGSVLLDNCLAGPVAVPGQAQSDSERLQLHESLIDLLCERKANVDNVKKVVVTAASIGSLSIVKKLSTAGVNLNVKHVPVFTDDGPLTPILAAVLNGHEDIVRYLAQCPGVDLNCLTDNKRSVLHWAAFKGYQSILQALWGLCSDIHNAREREKGMSVLHMAVYGNQVETVQWLLSCKEVDKHAVDGHGRDALQLAAYASMVESRCGHDVTLDIESYLRSTGLYNSQYRGKYHQTADDMNPRGRQVSHVSRHTVFHTWGNGVNQQLEPVKTDQCTDSDASDNSKAVQISLP